MLPSGLVLTYSRFGPVISGKETFSTYHSAKCAGIPSDKEGDHKLNEEVNRLWSLEAIGITDDPDPAFDAKENERIIKEFYETAEVINEYLHYRSLVDRPDLLAGYAKVFNDQLASGIIEEVDEDLPSQDEINALRPIDFISPQAVLQTMPTDVDESYETSKTRDQLITWLKEKIGRAMTLTEAVSAIELKEKMEDSSDSTSCRDDTSHSTASSDITSGLQFHRKVAQNLMLAANIERIFSLQQLGSHDLARIDAFLKDDLYLTFRELVTKDVVTPTPSQIRDGLDNDFTVFSVTQAPKALNAHCKALTSVHIEVYEGPWDNEQKMLEWIAQTTTLISNINCQRNTIDRKLIPRIFGQPQDIAKIASGLAQFGVSPLKIDILYTDADTTLCYAPKPMRYPHAAVVLPPSLEAPHCALITDPPRLS
ncbi:unnamed protein product [Heligmosomoides polygyrus]|uniref:39S ribosomal protein L50, mitochondrial n=1 Tax=Heligmosomoides polygyrus TaxID=6339 RepID=A0A3P8AQV1_HELPZ|nr:unnamed protein product [Heligmosomoides polygyrus]